MKGEKDLNKLLKTMKPKLNIGDYVFCVVEDLSRLNIEDTILTFSEQEGKTIIIKKELADSLNLDYSFVSSWISLTVHSSLEAVGLTAAFSTSLSESGISCNVVAAFYHDHIVCRQKGCRKSNRDFKQIFRIIKISIQTPALLNSIS